MRIFSSICILLSIISCQSADPEFIQLNFQKDLIPEGITIDPASKTLFLNSLKHDKIVRSKLDGTDTSTFIDSNQFGYLSGFGMTVNKNILYALGNSPIKNNNQSVLLMLNLDDGELIESIEFNDSSFTYLNDLAVGKKGEIFITDSESNKIYKVDYEYSKFELYLDSEEHPHTNGIAISNNNKHLYLASQKGIRIVDLKTNQIINQPNEYVGIDGLKFYKNSLIGIVNHMAEIDNLGVYRYYLNADGSKIIRQEQIIPYHDNFLIPTTLAIDDDYLYFVINSQLHLRNESDLGKMVPYILMKKKLE
jgi:hypothetical protein